MSSLRIALVCEGNPATSEEAFSGTAKRIFLALEDQGHVVVPVDASLNKWTRVLSAARTFSFTRARWRANFRYSNATCYWRGLAAKAALGRTEVDVVLQIGATFNPPVRKEIPVAYFCDWNMELHAREPKGKDGLRSGLSDDDLRVIRAEHRRRYSEAAAIFTISEKLRQSFLELYKLAENRVFTAYSGPNFDRNLIDTALELPKSSNRPTILFIGKEFVRKGGPLVAEAFTRVLKNIPNARLLFVGTSELPKEFKRLAGVEHLGLLDKRNPFELQRLLTAYREANVFVLPSRRDPFPTVVREAMFFGVPCIVSDIWAMREMVVHGETGYVIDEGDVNALTDHVLTLLTDVPLARRLGDAGRKRAEELFDWPAVGKVLSETLERLVSAPLL